MRAASLRACAVGVIFGVAMGGASACTTGAKKEAAKTALDAMSTNDRRETFEATCRVFDEHPEFVDEFYAQARHHRPLLDRFLMNAAKDLKERPIAEMTAKHLVENPDSLEQTLATTLDFIHPRKDARAAMDRAMASRAEIATDVLTDSPEAMTRILQASILALEKKPQARKSALTAVRHNRARMLAMMKQDPELMKEMTEQVLREAVKDKPVAEKALRAAKIIDDDDTKKDPEK